MIWRVQDVISENRSEIRESAVAISGVQDEISKIIDAIREVQASLKAQLRTHPLSQVVLTLSK